MKIINNTNLKYQTIGYLIDKIIKRFDGSTNYYHKINEINIEINKHKIKITIITYKKYTEWRFDEINE